jgi:hypothetical protein
MGLDYYGMTKYMFKPFHNIQAKICAICAICGRKNQSIGGGFNLLTKKT